MLWSTLDPVGDGRHFHVVLRLLVVAYGREADGVATHGALGRGGGHVAHTLLEPLALLRRLLHG